MNNKDRAELGSAKTHADRHWKTMLIINRDVPPDVRDEIDTLYGIAKDTKRLARYTTDPAMLEQLAFSVKAINKDIQKLKERK